MLPVSEFINEISEVRNQAELIYKPSLLNEYYDRIAKEITENLNGSFPILLPVMMGGVYYCGQLMQRLNFPLELDYLHATRYRDELHGSELKWLVPPSKKIQGRTVLVIDDILDQGVTLAGIINTLELAGAEKIETAVLVEKQCPRPAAIDLTYKGLDVPDRYVFGCGMDYKGYWRNLPGIYAVSD